MLGPQAACMDKTWETATARAYASRPAFQLLPGQLTGCSFLSLTRSLAGPTDPCYDDLQGIKLGVSSRGWASLRTDPKAKCVYVDDDFELITFDFVTEPSTRGAYLVPIRKAFKHTVPDQSKAVQVSHAGGQEVALGSREAGRVGESQGSGCSWGMHRHGECSSTGVS